MKTQSAKKSQDVILLVLPFISCVPVSQKLGGKVPFLLKGPFAIFFGGTDILKGLSNKVLLIREKMTDPRHSGPKRYVILGHFGPLPATLDLSLASKSCL